MNTTEKESAALPAAAAAFHVALAPLAVDARPFRALHGAAVPLHVTSPLASALEVGAVPPAIAKP